MIYTCSHSNYQSKDFKTYAISGNRGKDANYKGAVFSPLAPKLSFWKTWHNNIGIIPEIINNQFYIEEYYQQVLKLLNPHDIYHQLNNSVLLCYEENSEFCHRHIVAAWLEITLDISIPEVKIIDSNIIKLSRPSYIKSYLTYILEKDTNYQNKNHKKLIKL